MNAYKKGFTLIEMLVSVAIILVISGILLFNYGDFDIGVSLKGQSSEVALALREAQVNASNGKEFRPNTGTFKIKYGVFFNNAAKSFNVFGDLNNDNLVSASGNELLQPNAIRTGYTMSICAGDNGVCAVPVNGLSVVFASTTFQTSIKATLNPSDLYPSLTDYTYAEIKITSARKPTQFATIKVWSNGRIEN